MKCKYINKHVCCVGCKNYDETENLECISNELKKHSELFLFEKFWKKNFDYYKTGNSFSLEFNKNIWYIIVYYLETSESIACFESENIIDVCEQALKYKEENETEIKS
jgi:hypothetical protein